jgi:hypothetical protein
MAKLFLSKLFLSFAPRIDLLAIEADIVADPEAGDRRP